MDRPIPPFWPDRVRGMLDRNPLELGLAVWWLVAGIIFDVASVLPAFDPSPSFAVLPEWMPAVIGTPLVVGGAGLLWAMLGRWDDLAARWRLERACLSLCALSLTAFAVIVLAYRWQSLIPAGMALGMAACAALRVRASLRQENAIRDRRGG